MDLYLFYTKSAQDLMLKNLLANTSVFSPFSERDPVHVQLDVTLFCHDAAEVFLPENLKLPDSLLLIFKLKEKTVCLAIFIIKSGFRSQLRIDMS